jgi:hypothetical protein
MSIPGFNGATEILALEADDTAAIHSAVSLDEFEGECAQGHMQDPAWIVPRACQHERVVEEVMARSPVLPVRFGAVFSSRESLAQLLAERHEEISHFLETVSDKEEWDVRGFVDRGRASEWLLSFDADLAARRARKPDSPGARYFHEKRLRAEAEAQARAWCGAIADQIGNELASHAVGVCSLARGPRNSAEVKAETVLHLALLVLRSRVPEFCGCVEAIEAAHLARGLTLEVSGPWPPYSFCPAIGRANK